MLKNRILSLLIVLLTVFSFAVVPSDTVVYSAQADAVTIADLTNKSVIDKAGLVPGSVYIRTGYFSAKWGDSQIYDEVNIPVSNVSKIDSGYIEFWAYNEVPTNMEFAFVLWCDNPATPESDYYHTTIKANWTGWKKCSVYIKNTEAVKDEPSAEEPVDTMSWEEYDAYIATNGTTATETVSKSFIPSGTPLGIKNLTQIKLWPVFAGKTPVSGTNIHFDKICFSREKSSDAIISAEENSKNQPHILVDFTDSSLVSKKGYEYSLENSQDGMGSAKVSGDALKKGASFVPISDWTQYNRLNMEIYSEKANRARFNLGVSQENSATTGDDYYSGEVIMDWEGSWRTLSWTFDANGESTLSKARTPLGFDNVTGVSLWFTFSGEMPSDTVFYIKRIYLDKAEEEAEVFVDDNTDYIPKHNPNYITYDFNAGLRNTIQRKEHPRLLCSPEEWNKNMALYEAGDPYLTKVVQNVLYTADIYVERPAQETREANGKLLSAEPRDAIKSCAFAYAVTKEQKYFDALMEVLERASKWEDWGPVHWLDVAEMSYAFAIAYDLCYDYFTEAQRRTIRNAIMKHGIEEGCRTWRANGSVPRVASNWQEVCAGGVGIAALTLIDEPGYYDICAEFVNHAIRTLPTGLAQYAPDGAFPEGMAYWRYATKFFFNFDHALVNTVGSDYGLSDYPGLSKTGYFPIIAVGPVNAFNFSDAEESKEKVSDACMYYLSERYGDKVFATYRYQASLNSGVFEDFLSYRDYLIEDDYASAMKLDFHFGGQQDIVYTRSSMDDNATWLAYKGGSNMATHGDLDNGAFVLDMQGTRWIIDPGAGSYATTGYFNVSADGGGRWKVYKKRAESHATLVINPSKKTNQDQIVNSSVPVTEFKTSDSGSYGILDMTPSYADDVEKLTRGFALANNRNDVIIQDEIIAKEPAEVYSFFPSRQNIMLTDDPKVAYMYSEKGKKIRLDITSPANAKWEVMDNKPLPTSPEFDENFISGNGVPGQKLFIHLENVTNTTISVSVRNVYDGIEENAPLPCIAFDKWDTYLEESVSLDMLYVDGVPVSGFTQNCSSYSIKGSVGKLSADYDSSKVDVEIHQAQKLGDTAYIKVTSKDGMGVAYYYVSFDDVYIDIDPTAYKKINIVSATASAIPEPLNVPENTYDGDLANRWAAENDAWIIWELDGVHKFDQVLLSFWKGNLRATIFEIYVSKDNVNWELAFEGNAAGNTEALEAFKLNGIYEAKYVKYNGHGNDQNGWNSVQEVYIPELLEDFTDISGHWAQSDINQMRLLNLIKGKSDTIFDPESDITVAEFASLVSRCMELRGAEYKNAFKDVSSDDWYAKDMQALYDAGLIPQILVNDGYIYPDKCITREEMSVILANAYSSYYTTPLAKIDLTKFNDFSDITPQYCDYISKSVAARFVKGVGENLFAPKSNATRAEAATILKRLYIAKVTSPAYIE